MKQVIIKDGKIFCPYCNGNLTNSQIADYDLMINKVTYKKQLFFIRRCLSCNNKSYVFKKNFSISDNGEYVTDDLNNWTKIKDDMQKDMKNNE